MNTPRATCRTRSRAESTTGRRRLSCIQSLCVAALLSGLSLEAQPAAIPSTAARTNLSLKPLPELLTAAQVRSLTAEQAARHYPVRLRGVVTFYEQSLFSRFVQDE